MGSAPRSSLAIVAAVALCAAAACGASAPDATGGGADTEGTAGAARSEDLYAPWARVLSTHVDEEGLVDYAGLQRAGRADLEAFMTVLASTDVEALPSEAARKAFWINAYNAVTIQEVVERYPIDSVRDVGALFGLVGGFFKQTNLVAGAERSPDDIEHGILRQRFEDAEIHWTLVCAAFGCPRLLRHPYRADGLDALLDDLAREFLAQPRALQIDRDTGTLWLSSYFDWYGEDFEAASGSVVDYVLEFAPADAAPWIREHRDDLRVRIMDYDWTLNDQAKGPRSRRPVRPF